MKDNFFKELREYQKYIIAFSVVTIVLFILNPFAGLIGLLLFGFIISLLMADRKRDLSDREEYIMQLTDDFDSAAKHAIFNMPFPLVMTDKTGEIIWYNTAFLKLLNSKNLLGEKISQLILGFEFEDMKKDEFKKVTNVRIGEEIFRIYPNIIEDKRDEYGEIDLYMFYFVNHTDYVNLKNKYKDESIMIAHVYIDNLEEVKKSTDDINRTLFLAEVDKMIIDYFRDREAIIRKYENGRYIVILTRKTFETMKQENFSLLDKVRDMKSQTAIKPTISMGISDYDDPLITAYEESRSCVDIALARGGDQVVVRAKESHEFYGGRSKAIESRNRVKARVIGIALRNLIDAAEDVYIMGHKNADMDCFGSAIGILRSVQNRNKNGYIILNSSNPSIDSLVEEAKREQPDLFDHIVKSETAIENVNRKRSLLILVDNHKPSFTEAPEIIDIMEQIVVLDHHRRGTEFIERSVLTYIEPYASSTCELVTEMLNYMEEELNVTPFEANALMAGIVVDTKHFSFQTGVRTFEAASMLRRAGADMTKVKLLFNESMESLKLKAEVVNSAEIYYDGIAIGKMQTSDPGAFLVAAQAADELLDVEGVKASFVVLDYGEYIHISGRSLGDVSVQIICEYLGGGGHLVSAGAQLRDMTIDEAVLKLKESIQKYFKGIDEK
ncbi:MAG: DHH family phosphoesterase [Tissierellia bacterium]|nr:DHH family phosphoesterase [Tissierellia bacterium]